MNNSLNIFIDRLSDGSIEEINENVPPEIMDITENDLSFKTPIFIKGKTYVSADYLIINLDIKTTARMPCSMCNDDIEQEIIIPSSYFTHELDQIKGKVYNYTNKLREAILLETPAYTKCSGKCLTKEKLGQHSGIVEAHFPFACL